MKARLSKVNLAIEIMNDALECDSVEKMSLIYEKLILAVGATGLMLTTAPETQKALGGNTIPFGSFNNGWAEEYVAKSYHMVDPVARALRAQRGGLINWTTYFESEEHNKGSKDFLKRAKINKLTHGWTFGSLPTPQAPIACITAIAVYPGAVTSENEEIIRTLLPHINRAINKPTFMKQTEVSETQRNVLKWAAAGKTNWEISIILNMSESGVKYHVAQVGKKLSVVGRAQILLRAKTLLLIV
jgi:LuxR family quorum sensing-dependent transcriptional regulator